MRIAADGLPEEEDEFVDSEDDEEDTMTKPRRNSASDSGDDSDENDEPDAGSGENNDDDDDDDDDEEAAAALLGRNRASRKRKAPKKKAKVSRKSMEARERERKQILRRFVDDTAVEEEDDHAPRTTEEEHRANQEAYMRVRSESFIRAPPPTCHGSIRMPALQSEISVNILCLAPADQSGERRPQEICPGDEKRPRHRRRLREKGERNRIRRRGNRRWCWNGWPRRRRFRFRRRHGRAEAGGAAYQRRPEALAGAVQGRRGGGAPRRDCEQIHAGDDRGPATGHHVGPEFQERLYFRRSVQGSPREAGAGRCPERVRMATRRSESCAHPGYAERAYSCSEAGSSQEGRIRPSCPWALQG